ncbi:glycoside hydrolase family 26 protein [Deinococcus xianganensis]|uniref:Endoglucanase n=1 Tax=Deinococcus xianganensis TaxID=1507289 RepID=A0A6I4YF54_9DEIO|nr:glycosyl hydrolase [Deinococcus xianganensis]MXV19518.1 endoglucanase [Deinococcus xianganensis]
MPAVTPSACRLARRTPFRPRALHEWILIAALSGLTGLPTAHAAPLPSCGVFGLTVDSPAVLDALERKVGCRFGAVRWFQDWNTPFNQAYARTLSAQGRELELSWQPRVRAASGVRGVPYRDIAAGRHDAYLRQFARDMRRGGVTVRVTFAPEMNGNWGAYQLTRSNTPADFVRAWRRIVNVFRAEKAPVRWVWTPNILYPDMPSSYRALYPGGEWVHEVGLDGYNWGTTNPWNRWLSFRDTFAASYRQLKLVAGDKPVQLGELASVEQGGSKAAWIRDMCAALPGFGQIRRAFWFHLKDGRVDWRITTSEASLDAFRRCVRTRR